MEIEFTGGTAQVRDKANVKVKRILRAASADFLAVLTKKYDGDITQVRDAKGTDIRSDGELMSAMDTFGCTAMVLLIESWSLEQPLPKSVEEWGEFEDADVYDEILNKVTPHAYELLNGQAMAVSPETVADPESPTEPSSDSNGGGQDPTTHMTLLPAG